MNKTTRIFNICLYAVTAVFVCLILFNIYICTGGKGMVPSAITSTYATRVTDPETGEDLPIIEANYYANANHGRGYEVVELLFNAYSGTGKQAIYSRGFQLIILRHSNGMIIGQQLYYLDRNNSKQGFVSAHPYAWGDKMPININDKLYGIALDGTYLEQHWEPDWRTHATGWLFGLSYICHWGGNMVDNAEATKYTWEDLLLKVAEIIRSCSNGTGDSVISLVDLANYLHVYEYDEESGQFAGEAIGARTLQNSYFTMQTHYDLRGMVTAKQSMFGSVAGDSNFNISGVSDNVDYYQATATCNLTEADFEENYSAVDGGYYYSLPTAKINEIKGLKNIELNITFNIANLNKKVLGFYNHALYGVKVKSLSITADQNQDFALMTNCLKDTGLTQITTKNINLINNGAGVEL